MQDDLRSTWQRFPVLKQGFWSRPSRFDGTSPRLGWIFRVQSWYIGDVREAQETFSRSYHGSWVKEIASIVTSAFI